MIRNIPKIACMNLPSIYNREINSILNILPLVDDAKNKFRKRTIGRVYVEMEYDNIIDNNIYFKNINYIPISPDRKYDNITYAPTILIEEFDAFKYLIRNTIGYGVYNNILFKNNFDRLYLDVHYHIVKDIIPFKKYTENKDWNLYPLSNTVIFNPGVVIHSEKIKNNYIIIHSEDRKNNNIERLNLEENNGIIVPNKYYNIYRDYEIISNIKNNDDDYRNIISNPDIPSCSYVAIEIGF
jgi:hypothetical protein